MSYTSFDEIHLLRKEKRCIFTFRFRKKQTIEEISCFKSLHDEYGFLKLNYTGILDEYGSESSDGTYSLSDRYYRYKIHKREWVICHIPNWAAIVISLIPYAIKGIEWIIKHQQQISQWLNP